jgi:hypothetical protein
MTPMLTEQAIAPPITVHHRLIRLFIKKAPPLLVAAGSHGLLQRFNSAGDTRHCGIVRFPTTWRFGVREYPNTWLPLRGNVDLVSRDERAPVTFGGHRRIDCGNQARVGHYADRILPALDPIDRIQHPLAKAHDR